MMVLKKLPLREQVEEKYKWRLEDIYENDDLWKKDYATIEEKIVSIEKFQDNINTAENLWSVLCLNDEISQKVDRIFTYARMRRDEDNANSKYQSMADKALSLVVETSSRLSFIEPEILALSKGQIQEFMQQKPQLKLYEHYLENLFRMKNHILDAEKEKILAQIGEIAQAPADTFRMFDNADIRFPKIKDENDDEIELTKGRYASLMESYNRDVRKAAFEGLHGTYKNFINTLTTTLTSNIKKNIFYKNQRGFKSSLEASLFVDNISTKVYDNLIDAISSRLDLMYRYVALRRKVLKLDKLHMYDLYVPLVENFDRKISYEEAKNLVLEGLSPLGKEYTDVLQEAYSSGWIDVYENRGKTGGAYSWGTYGVHPYVLMNFQGRLNDVFTLAHELGHAMHTYYSDKNQPYIYSQYTIFLAEIASTCNETLLTYHLINKSKDRREKLFLINHFLEQFKGTVFRQVMFAEFEKMIHELAEKGEPLNAQKLCQIYHKLNEKYYGPDIVVDELIDYEWARIPHFYTSFYVYKYATGFSAAIALANMILEEGQSAAEKYIEFLSKGNSDYSLTLLKEVGVDLNTSKPILNALKVFENLLDEFEATL